MRRRTHQNRKKQEPSQLQAQSISLYSDQSLIQEYHELEFSDEKSRDNFSSSSENACQELSQDKLKFLGVDKYPLHNAHKMIEPDTQSETYLMQQNISHPQEQKYQKKQEQSKFNIDSFLNSHTNKVKNLLNDKVNKKKHNSFFNDEQILSKKKHSRYNQHHQKYPYKKKQFSIISQESDSDATASLMTLPQPSSNIKRNEKNIKFKSDTEKNKDEIFKLRFEQAKLKFLDCFLPDGMKIQNNPYAFYKYSQRKSYNLIR